VGNAFGSGFTTLANELALMGLGVATLGLVGILGVGGFAGYQAYNRHFRLEEDHVFEPALSEYWLRVFVEPARGNEDRMRAGVGKDVLDLFERLRCVNGNVYRAETQDREIHDRPLRTVFGEQRDPIARPDAKPREAESDILDAFDECCSRDIVPLAFRTMVERVLFVVTQDSFED